MVGFVIVDRAELLPDQFPWGASLLEVTALTMLGFVIMTVVAQLTGPGSGGRVALIIGVAALGSLAIPRTNTWLWPTAPSFRSLPTVLTTAVGVELESAKAGGGQVGLALQFVQTLVVADLAKYVGQACVATEIVHELTRVCSVFPLGVL